jgi:hypothetical protein
MQDEDESRKHRNLQIHFCMMDHTPLRLLSLPSFHRMSLNCGEKHKDLMSTWTVKFKNAKILSVGKKRTCARQLALPVVVDTAWAYLPVRKDAENLGTPIIQQKDMLVHYEKLQKFRT